MGRQGRVKRTGRHRVTGRTKCRYCGKVVYESRKRAKEAIRFLHPNESMSAYQCIYVPEYADATRFWHIGHLDRGIKNGQHNRDEYYGSCNRTFARPDAQYDIIDIELPDDDNSSGGEDNDNDLKGLMGMPTVAEMIDPDALGINLGKYAEVTIDSSTARQYEMLHSALRAHATTHGFEPYIYKGKHGKVGQLSLSKSVRELFRDGSTDEDRLDNLAATLTKYGRRKNELVCINVDDYRQSGPRGNVRPIWWVSDEFDEEPDSGKTNPPKAVGVSKEVRRHSAEVKRRILVLLEGTPRGFDVGEIEAEIQSGYARNSLAHVLNALVDEGDLVKRKVKSTDVDTLLARRTDYPRKRPRSQWLYGSPAHFDYGHKIRVSEDEPEEQPEEQPEEHDEPPVPEDEPMDAQSDDSYGENAKPAVLLSGEDVDRMNRRIAELQLVNDKLTSACNELLSVINIMKGGSQ